MSQIHLNKKQWSKIHLYLSARAATGPRLLTTNRLSKPYSFYPDDRGSMVRSSPKYGSYVTAW